MSLTPDHITEQLRAADLRVTTARVDVLSAFEDQRTAVSYTDLRRRHPKMDRVTLYRTLQSLREKGIIHEAFSDGDETHYAVCGQACGAEGHHHHHAHFRCGNCGTVRCVPLEESIRISLPGYRVEGVDVTVSGVCEGCLGG